MNDSQRMLRQLAWTYFWLLLFEGAFRKWITPGLSSVLLLIRDPVVIMLYAAALGQNVFPFSVFTAATGLLAALSLATSVAGYGTMGITLYGIHADFLHLPLIVLLPKIFTRKDVARIGLMMLIISVPMLLLSIVQFKGGPESYWNVGAGGTVGGQLYAAAGKVRVSGTFSFVTGMVSYISISAAFVLYGLMSRRIYPKLVLMAALPSLIVTLVISGSRSAVAQVAIVCVLVILMSFQRPEAFGAALKPLILTVACCSALTYMTPIFDEGLAVHKARFESAGGVKEGMVDRFFGELAGGFNTLFVAPTLGYGIGLGTSAGAQMLSGRTGFMLGEGEWDRVLYESGPFIGGAYLLLRIFMAIHMTITALQSYARGQPLSLLLLSTVLVGLVTSQFGQPTELGFVTFFSGLTLAAARDDEDEETAPEAVRSESPPHLPRGLSPYAARLHAAALSQEQEQASAPSAPSPSVAAEK